MSKKTWKTIAIIAVVLVLVSCSFMFEKQISHLLNDRVQVFEDVQETFDEMVIDAGATLTDAPVVLADFEDLEGYEVVKIGLPVKSITDCTEDATFTVYLVEGDETGWEEKDEFELVIKADTYKKNTICEWVYFEVEINVEKNQTLAFGSAEDTIQLAYDSTNSETMNYYKDVFGTPQLVNAALYIDIYAYELK